MRDEKPRVILNEHTISQVSTGKSHFKYKTVFNKFLFRMYQQHRQFSMMFGTLKRLKRSSRLLLFDTKIRKWNLI